MKSNCGREAAAVPREGDGREVRLSRARGCSWAGWQPRRCLRPRANPTGLGGGARGRGRGPGRGSVGPNDTKRLSTFGSTFYHFYFVFSLLCHFQKICKCNNATSYRFGGCGGTESPPSFLGLQSQGGNKRGHKTFCLKLKKLDCGVPILQFAISCSLKNLMKYVVWN